MTRSIKILLFISLVTITSNKSFAQTDTTHKHRIAIFAPLYLDSAFNSLNEYRYAKNALPKFINPGLEFYEGAQLALDSMAREGTPLEVFVYDTRAANTTIQDILNKPELDSMELFIVHCASNEVKFFADAGLKKNIPVINANLPNEGGVTGNPFFLIINSTLRTHCEGIYRHIQKFFPLEEIVMFRKKGQLEDRIKNYFDDMSKTTAGVPLKIKYVDLVDSFTVNQVSSVLDSNKQFLCIAGSLDENFGKRLTAQLAALRKSYPVTVMGMPTWDGIKDFTKPEWKGLEIIYGTPFYNNKMDKVSTMITNYFTTKMFARPSDMVYRGYEVTWKYAKLLLHYGKDLSSELGNKNYRVFTDFDIQPVFSKQGMILDYFENRKLYFLRWSDGMIKGVY